MIRRNTIKIKKPFNNVLDEAIKNGYGMIDTKEQNGYGEWMYLSKIKKYHKGVFDIKPINHRNKFMVTVKADIHKNKKRSSGSRYSWYDLLTKR